jgi:hypothetical protein
MPAHTALVGFLKKPENGNGNCLGDKPVYCAEGVLFNLLILLKPIS